MQTSRNAVPLVQIVPRRQLAEQIAALTEEIEELRSRQAMILHNLDCKNNGEAQRFGSYLDKLEEMREKLVAQRESLVQQLSATTKQYLEIETTIQPEDADTVQQCRNVLRPTITVEREQMLSFKSRIDNVLLSNAEQSIYQMTEDNSMKSQTEYRKIEKEKER